MALISVPAVYDGKNIRLLEIAPVNRPYHVLVTFVEPTNGEGTLPKDSAHLLASFCAWKDERPIEETLRDIHQARKSKTEPLAL